MHTNCHLVCAASRAHALCVLHVISWLLRVRFRPTDCLIFIRRSALSLRSFVNSVTEQLTGTLSLGAAVFASVLFASGMPSEFDVVSATAAAAAGKQCY
jgi:hypothetical protein